MNLSFCLCLINISTQHIKHFYLLHCKALSLDLETISLFENNPVVVLKIRISYTHGCLINYFKTIFKGSFVTDECISSFFQIVLCLSQVISQVDILIFYVKQSVEIRKRNCEFTSVDNSKP